MYIDTRTYGFKHFSSIRAVSVKQLQSPFLCAGTIVRPTRAPMESFADGGISVLSQKAALPRQASEFRATYFIPTTTILRDGWNHRLK